MTAGRRAAGVSMVEAMVVVAIIGILASMGVPRFFRAIEQSRADVAAANLRAIWAAQRAYWMTNGNTFAPDLATLRAAKLLDPGLVDDPGGESAVAPGVAYVYQVASSDGSTFRANARRVNTSAWSGAITIDQDGNSTGTIQPSNASAGSAITPAFP